MTRSESMASRQAEAERFLFLLDEGAETFCFQTFDDSPAKCIDLARSFHSTLEDLWPRLDALNEQGAGVFVTVNETDGNGRKAANIKRGRAIFADFDPPKTSSPPERYPLPPVFEVETSPGKRHAYWTCDSLSLKDFRAVQRAIVAKLDSDPAPIDLPRVMRLPGFYHQKNPAHPHLVRLLSEDMRLPYTPDDIRKAFPPPAPAPAAHTAVESASEIIAPAQIRNLQSALRSMPADDYELWIRMGLALRTLGDVGRALWFEWSATSVKFDSSEAAKKWETFKPDRTGYAAVFAEAKRQGWGNSNPLQPYPHTDLGNAERLRARHGQSLRYCPQVEKWLYWDEERWLWDEDGHIVRCATESVRSIYPEAENIQDDDQRKKLMTHGLKSEAAPRIESMIKLTRSLEGIPLPVTSLDGDPMLVGVIGGTLDLAAGQFLPARRSNYITKRANVEYLPDAACPRWIEFLEEIFSGDQDLIAFIQRIVGYCLTGDTREQCLFVLHGHGANGKSVFLRVLHALLGDYAMETLPATLMETRRGRSATNDIARLRGSRMVSASEPDEGCTLAEGVVKQLTGQDKVTCRFLYAEFFEYQPQFKILLVTNHKPVIKSDGHAIWRRLHLVPFEVTISPERQDKELAAKLVKSELPGILNWALEGLRDWLERGLAPPEVVVDSTQEYRDEMDIIGDWLAECCTLSPQIGHTPTASLYDSYKKFCYVGNLHPLSNRAFGRKLADRGFKPAKGTKGTRGFRGIGLQGVQQSPAENLLQTRLGNKYAQDLEPQVPETAERR